MSNIEKCKELIARYSAARIPFIAINTIERGRTLEILRDVASKQGLSFWVHTLSKGIYDIVTEKTLSDEKSVFGAIDYMSEQIKRRQNLTLILTEVPDIRTDTNDAKQLLDLVTMAEETAGVIIVITNNILWNQLQRLGLTIKLDLPDEEEMHSVVKEYLDSYKNDIIVEWDENDICEAAAMLVGITRIEAQNIIAILIAKNKITKSDLDEIRGAKDRLFSDISGLEKIAYDDSVKDVGGLAALHKWLNEKKLLLTLDRRNEMRARGLQSPRGILLVGVPGCGKSLSAKSIAANWRLPLYRLDFATVQGSYVGQSEQQLKNALQTAESVSPCVLWIDEIEKGLSGAAYSNDGGVSARMVGQFLFWLQESKKQVFVVATANDISMLPSELLRRGRFDEIFFIDLPTPDERREILGMYMKKYLNLEFEREYADKIVEITNGFTGADIESTVRDLAYRTIANRDFVPDAQLIITAFNNVIPLSQTSPERIEAIRDWGRQRAVPASGRPIGEQKCTTYSSKSSKIRQVLV